MARGRMLNRNVAVSEKMHALGDDSTRLLATWIIPWLDKHGVFHADPRIVRSTVFPFRDDLSNTQVSAMLDKIAACGLFLRFEAEGRTWMVWPGFALNQKGFHAEREKTDYPQPPAKLQQLPAKLQQLPDTTGESGPEVQGEGEVETKEKEKAAAPEKRRAAGFASVHTEHADERVSAYLDILGQKQITETNAALILERIAPGTCDIWREVLTAWAVGGELGPYKPSNFTGMFDRYDSAKNARRFPKASANGNSKHAMPDIVDGAREILRQRAAARGETI